MLDREYLEARRPNVKPTSPDELSLAEWAALIVVDSVDSAIAEIERSGTAAKVSLAASVTVAEVAPPTDEGYSVHPDPCIRICIEIGGRTRCFHSVPR